MLNLTDAGGNDLPYLGYTEVDLAFGGKSYGISPLLVVNDTPYNVRVPLLIGTNVLNKIKQDLLEQDGVRFLQKSSLPSAVLCALQAMCLSEKHVITKASSVILDL